MLLFLACAWHRKYTGRRKLLRIVSWWPPFPIRVSHGLCRDCKVRVREEWRAVALHSRQRMRESVR